MAHTTTELIAKIKLWATIPAAQPAFTNAQILDIATDELWNYVSPFIINHREEYYVTFTDSDISTAENQTFDIPGRSAGGVLREVKLINSDGFETDLPRINPEYRSTTDFGFFLRDNKVWLLRSENYSSYSLRLYYYRRPSELVLPAACAPVTATGTTTFEATVPSTMTTGDTVDVVQVLPPFGTLKQDITATWSGTTVTPSSYPTGLAVGDYMCPVRKSCVPQIPVEVWPVLVQAVVVKIQEILGDQGNLRRAQEKLEKVTEDASSLLSPRVVGEVKRIKNHDGFIHENAAWFRGWWG
jgi:hypothetical protein